MQNLSDVVIDLPDVEVEVPVEAIQLALSQLNVSDVTPTVDVELAEDVIRDLFPSNFDVRAVSSCSYFVYAENRIFNSGCDGTDIA